MDKAAHVFPDCNAEKDRFLFSVRKIDFCSQSYHPLFNSPEHMVLKVSFCDRPVSVVRRWSNVVRRQHFFFQMASPSKPLGQF